MNINDKVWVRLTNAGVRRWKTIWPIQYVHEDGRWFDITMHSLMHLVGPVVYEGSQLIEENLIALEDPTKKPSAVPVGPATPITHTPPVPATPLTRTEIFLRLVDSFCRQPAGFNPGKGDNYFIFIELRNQASMAYDLWGGK